MASTQFQLNARLARVHATIRASAKPMTIAHIGDAMGVAWPGHEVGILLERGWIERVANPYGCVDAAYRATRPGTGR